MNKQIEQAYKDRPRSTVYQIVVSVIVVALIVWSGSAVEFTGGRGKRRADRLKHFKGESFIDPKLLFNFTMQGVPYLLLETVCIAFLGTLVGAVLAIPFSFLSASNLMPAPIAWLSGWPSWQSVLCRRLSMD